MEPPQTPAQPPAQPLGSSPPFDSPEQPGGAAQKPGQLARSVRVTVMQAEGLPRMDLMGKNDPYVVLAIDGATQRTPTVDDGGKNPVFGADGAGEPLLFERCAGSSATLQAFDEDLDADDLIGTADLPLPAAAAAAEAEAAGEESWLELLSAKGKKAGRVRVVVHAWDEPPPPAEAPAEPEAAETEPEPERKETEDGAEAEAEPEEGEQEQEDEGDEDTEVEEVGDEEVAAARRARAAARRVEKEEASSDEKQRMILEDEGLAEAERCEKGTWGMPDIGGIVSLLRDEPHCTNPVVVARACDALQTVAWVDAHIRTHLDLQLRQTDAVTALCEAVKTHWKSGAVLERGFWALETLLRDDGPEGEWGGEHGKCGASVKVAAMAAGMDDVARAAIANAEGSGCEREMEGVALLAGRSLARAFLEKIGTATADEMAQIDMAKASSAVKKKRRKKGKGKGGPEGKEKKKGGKKKKIKQKEEGTLPRPSSRDSNDSRGSGGASRLNADGSTRGGLEAEEPIGPVGEISGWGTAP